MTLTPDTHYICMSNMTGKNRAYENTSYTVHPFREDYKSGDMVLENQSFTFIPHHKYQMARKMIVISSIISAITSAAITYFILKS